MERLAATMKAEQNTAASVMAAPAPAAPAVAALTKALSDPEAVVRDPAIEALGQIGPAARNLFGGREAAQRICRAVVKH